MREGAGSPDHGFGCAGLIVLVPARTCGAAYSPGRPARLARLVSRGQRSACALRRSLGLSKSGCRVYTDGSPEMTLARPKRSRRVSREGEDCHRSSLPGVSIIRTFAVSCQLPSKPASRVEHKDESPHPLPAHGVEPARIPRPLIPQAGPWTLAQGADHRAPLSAATSSRPRTIATSPPHAASHAA